MGAKRGTPAERLWRRVIIDQPDECWPWTGRRIPGWHGQINVSGVAVLTHRLAWELTNGPVPDGLFVLHTCDNPPCCNPGHLFLGTRADNSADMKSKGRQTHGEKNPRAVLTWEQVVAMRSIGQAVPTKDLAGMMGVSPRTVRDVLEGRTWQTTP